MSNSTGYPIIERDISHSLSIESIEASSVCTDGFEVTNLISDDSNSRSRGFLAANFVRPPVSIAINFKERNDIDTIVIGICVGEQVVSSLEVFTLCEGLLKNGTIISRERKVAAFVANSDYYPKYLVFSRWELQQEHCRVSADVLSGVRRLLIKIRGMKNAGTPCLSSLNLFCRQQCFDSFHSGVSHTPSETSITVRNESEPPKQINEPFIDGDCPEEFKDAITHELMSKPFLLPSGFNIDESSVIKITQLAESQGRIPYDPFSYQEFSLSNRPIENLPLLDRIRAYNRNTRVTKSRVIQKFS